MCLPAASVVFQPGEGCHTGNDIVVISWRLSGLLRKLESGCFGDISASFTTCLFLQDRLNRILPLPVLSSSLFCFVFKAEDINGEKTEGHSGEIENQPSCCCVGLYQARPWQSEQLPDAEKRSCHTFMAAEEVV